MTWVPSLVGGVPVPQLHDLTHSPVGLWQLNGDMLDTSGNANHLSVGAGTERYCPGISFETKAFWFDGLTHLVGPVAGVLQVTGAVTLELLFYPTQISAGSPVHIALLAGAPADEAEAANILYHIGVRFAHSSFWSVFEQGVLGTDVDIQPSPELNVTNGMWHHLAYTRSGAGANKLYHNGDLIHSGSEGNPTGGTGSNLKVGGFNGVQQVTHGAVCSVKVIASELTPAQVAAEADRTLPLGITP